MLLAREQMKRQAGGLRKRSELFAPSPQSERLEQAFLGLYTSHVGFSLVGMRHYN